MKLIFLIVFLGSLWIIESRRVRTNRVECGSSEKYTVKVYCYLKAYDRKNPLLNGGFTTTHAPPNPTTFVGFYRKSGDRFDSILTYRDLPVCKLIRESTTTLTSFTPFIQLMVKSLKQHVGSLFEACDRIGEITLRNLSIQDLPVLSQWPKGQYKVELRFFNDIDDNIVNTTLFMTVLG